MDTIKLSKRLYAISTLISKNSIVADIGTDHAFLPCYLVQTGWSKSALACDIADGPLISAKKTVISNKLEDKISLIKSDGLENVPITEITDVIIAGMGGELILEIILRDIRTKTIKLNYILQPMTAADKLRRGLYQNGFCIVREIAVTENTHNYSVMQVKYTGVKSEISYIFSLLGSINKSDSKDALEYIKAQKTRLINKVEGLQKSESFQKDYEATINLLKELEDQYLK